MSSFSGGSVEVTLRGLLNEWRSSIAAARQEYRSFKREIESDPIAIRGTSAIAAGGGNGGVAGGAGRFGPENVTGISNGNVSVSGTGRIDSIRQETLAVRQYYTEVEQGVRRVSMAQTQAVQQQAAGGMASAAASQGLYDRLGPVGRKKVLSDPGLYGMAYAKLYGVSAEEIVNAAHGQETATRARPVARGAAAPTEEQEDLRKYRRAAAGGAGQIPENLPSIPPRRGPSDTETYAERIERFFLQGAEDYDTEQKTVQKQRDLETQRRRTAQARNDRYVRSKRDAEYKQDVRDVGDAISRMEEDAGNTQAEADRIRTAQARNDRYVRARNLREHRADVAEVSNAIAGMESMQKDADRRDAERRSGERRREAQDRTVQTHNENMMNLRGRNPDAYRVMFDADESPENRQRARDYFLGRSGDFQTVEQEQRNRPPWWRRNLGAGVRAAAGFVAADTVAGFVNSGVSYQYANEMGGGDQAYAARTSLARTRGMFESVPLVGRPLFNIGNATLGAFGGPTEQEAEANLELSGRMDRYTDMRKSHLADFRAGTFSHRAVMAGGNTVSAARNRLNAAITQRKEQYGDNRESARQAMEAGLKNDQLDPSSDYHALTWKETDWSSMLPFNYSGRSRNIERVARERGADNDRQRQAFRKEWDKIETSERQMKDEFERERSLTAIGTTEGESTLAAARQRNEYRPWAARATEASGAISAWASRATMDVENVRKKGEELPEEDRNRINLQGRMFREDLLTAQRELRDRDLYGNTVAFNPFTQSTEAFVDQRIENREEASKSLEDAMRRLEETVAQLSRKMDR